MRGNGFRHDVESGEKCISLLHLKAQPKECLTETKFLVDSGAQVSLIKPFPLRDIPCFKLKKPLIVKGIGNGLEEMNYWTYLTLPGGFSHAFFITRPDFDFKEDGIIGNDFLKSFNAKIDYQENSLQVKDYKFQLENTVESVINMESNETQRREKSLKTIEPEAENERKRKENICLVDGDATESAHCTYSSPRNEENDENVDEGENSDNCEVFQYDMHFDAFEVCDEEIEKKMSQSEECSSVMIPKRSAVYANVLVNGDGEGIIPKFEIAENIFTTNCLVKAEHNKAHIIIVNATENDHVIELPIFDLEKYERGERTESANSTFVNAVSLNYRKRFERLKEMINFSHLNEYEIREIEPILEDYSDVFFLEGDKLCKNEMFEHKIVLKDHKKPINTRPYKTPYHLKNEMEKQIQKLKKEDLIQDSNSTWNSPVLLVPKKIDNSGEKKY